MEELIHTGSCDTSYSLSDRARFRVNIFAQRGHYSIVLRKLNAHIPSIHDLSLPDIIMEAGKEKTGLVLVTGATGSGKSTTLAALLNEINHQSAIHIITLEDPVEFVYTQDKATINQRELGSDYDNFANGLRAALRQAPKVILVGEMRDRATVEIALNAAETGHLVFSTLHTIDCGQTINRILGMFDTEEQEQVRYRLADTLRWVVSQRLAPKVNGGRFPLIEVMGSNLRTKESIVQGESEGKSFYEIIDDSSTFGWRTFDLACLEAFKKGVITEETALAYCSKRGHVSRGIDAIRKARGEETSDISDLQMKKSQESSIKNKPSNAPITLKLK
jgi:twitching motility protein PilT